MGLTDHIEKLFTLAALSETGSFHQAARRLAVSQPALSRSIRSLESSLGVSLLSRSARGVRLTREGKLLLELSERVRRQTEDIEARLKSANDPIAGKLAVATFESIAIHFWPRFLSRFAKKHPALLLSLSTIEEKSHYPRLGAGKLDLVVAVEPPADELLFSTIVGRDRYHFFASPGPRRPEAGLALISVPDASDSRHKTVRHYLDEAGLGASVSYEVDTFESAKALAREGLGTAILPEKVARDEVRAGRLERVTPKGFPTSGFGEHRICATLRREDRTLPTISAVVQALKKAWQES